MAQTMAGPWAEPPKPKPKGLEDTSVKELLDALHTRLVSIDRNSAPTRVSPGGLSLIAPASSSATTLAVSTSPLIVKKAIFQDTDSSANLSQVGIYLDGMLVAVVVAQTVVGNYTYEVHDIDLSRFSVRSVNSGGHTQVVGIYYEQEGPAQAPATPGVPASPGSPTTFTVGTGGGTPPPVVSPPPVVTPPPPSGVPPTSTPPGTPPAVPPPQRQPV